MTLHVYTIAGILAISLAACSGHPSGDPAPHVTPVTGAELCDEACAKMRIMPLYPDAAPEAFACEESLNYNDGDGGIITCEMDCIQGHKDGVFWNTECIVNTITYCSEIEPVCNPPS